MTGRLRAAGSACFPVPAALQNRTDTGIRGSDLGCTNPHSAEHGHDDSTMRHKGNVSEKINHFCLQMKKYSSERYRHTLSGV